MTSYVHFACELCSKRVNTTDHRRILGRQKYFYKLRTYRLSNDDPISPLNVICVRCHGSLSKDSRLWIPPSYMKIMRQNGLHEDVLPQPLEIIPDDQELAMADPMEIDHENENLEVERAPAVDENPVIEENLVFSENSVIAQNAESENSNSVTQHSTSSSGTQRSSGLEIHVLPSSQSKCCICGNSSSRNSVPKSAITGAWLDTRVFVPYKNRTCKTHIVDGEFDESSLDIIRNKGILSIVPGAEFLTLNEEISKLCENRGKKKVITLEDDSLSDEQVRTLFGINQEQIDVLYSYIVHDLRNSKNRTTKDALGMYLMKLRLNMPQEAIAIFFGVSSQSRVSETIAAVADSIYTRFTPQYLGFGHLTSEELQKHQSKYLQAIFDLEPDSNLVIADGTYIYIDRPSGEVEFFFF